MRLGQLLPALMLVLGSLVLVRECARIIARNDDDYDEGRAGPPDNMDSDYDHNDYEDLMRGKPRGVPAEPCLEGRPCKFSAVCGREPTRYRRGLALDEGQFDDLGGGSSRVTNGVDSVKGEWPMFAIVTVDLGKARGVQVCAGVLISDRYVLTSAFCTISRHGKKYAMLGIKVTLGEHDKRATSPMTHKGLRVVGHCEYTEHKDYMSSVRRYWALLELEKPINFTLPETRGIHPVCVPSREYQIGPKSRCLLVGLGETYKLTNWSAPVHYVSRYLQKLPMEPTRCIPGVEDGNPWDNRACYRVPGDTRGDAGGACGDDFGAPLMCNQNDTWTLTAMWLGAPILCDDREDTYKAPRQFYDMIRRYDSINGRCFSPDSEKNWTR